jgi:DNA-binding CsgD family transcriptional regulator
LRERHSTLDGRLIPALIIVFGTIAVLVVIDIVADVGQGTAPAHVAVEAGIGLFALIGVAALVRRVVREARRADRLARELGERLETTRQDAIEWRTEAQDLLKGLGAKIDSQFVKWHLTPAEKEVALFLLKGFSHREIASLRKVSEATARQQARSVYRKAGISGRHDLAGFFLEDLVLPSE